MITSVSYRKSGSPQPEAYTNTSGTFRVKKANSVEPPGTPKIPQVQSKSRSFWQNLFRPKTEPVSPTPISKENKTTTLERSRSSETVNSICSTNSFSFVSSPRKYKGRKKGKRIPLQEDSLSRPPRPHTRQKIGTLTRLGMKIGLKSKYNLQSCESLHRLNPDVSPSHQTNTNSLNRTNRKKRAPLPPPTASNSGVQLNRVVVRSEFVSPKEIITRDADRMQVFPSTSAQAYGHRRCFSEGTNYNGYISPKSRYHVRGKRRAPPPPNPFGDPDAPEEIEELSNPKLPIVAENEELAQPCISRESNLGCSKMKAKSPRNSYVEKEVQSEIIQTSNSLLNHEKTVNDAVKAQLAILKSEADASPLRLVKPTSSHSSKDVNQKAGTSSVCPVDFGSNNNTSNAVETPVKLAPKPWYKRSSSKSPPKKNTKPTVMLLAKFSDLDREASRIIEENRRRSAELSYNETAKGLISMFNEFNMNQQTGGNVNGSTSSSSSVQPVSALDSNTPTSSKTSGTNGILETSTSPAVKLAENSKVASPSNSNATTEEPKKLAVVQPQANPQKSKPNSSPCTNTTTTTSTTTAIPPSLTSPAVGLFDYRVHRSTSSGAGVVLPSPLRLPPNQNQGEWSCPRCTLKNEYWRSFCDACHYRNTSNSSVQSITTLFDNVNRQIEMRVANGETTAPVVNGARPVNSGAQAPAAVQKSTKPSQTASSVLSSSGSSSQVPPCENFLSQHPQKEKIAKEEKLVGMKLQHESGDPEIEELDIEKLRKARVAFFDVKNKSSTTKEEMKPNNLASPCSSKSSTNKNLEVKGNVFTQQSQTQNDDEAMDALLEIHQQLNPNTSGTGPQTWKPLNVQKFQPMLESIVESCNDHYSLGSTSNPVYENWNSSDPSTNMFMQNIQTQLKDHIRYFEQLSSRENTPEENDTMERKRDKSLEDYQKLGAIPKHYQNGRTSDTAAGQSCSPRGRRHSDDYRFGSSGRKSSKSLDNGEQNDGRSRHSEDTLAISKLLRKLEWAIAKGDHRLAASLAHDLAMCKVNCVVSKATQQILIRVYVEDRFMQQGPFQVQVTPATTVQELKAKIECDWGIPMNFQKWILGRKIAEDDNQTLGFYETVHDSMAFLYLVTPGPENENVANERPKPENKGLTHATTRAKHPSPVNHNHSVAEGLSQASASSVIGREVQSRIPPNLPKPTPIRTAQQIPSGSPAKSLNLYERRDSNEDNNFVPSALPKTQQNGLKKNLGEVIPPKPQQNNFVVEKISSSTHFPEIQKAEVKVGPPAEAASPLPTLSPKEQSALTKPGSPECLTVAAVVSSQIKPTLHAVTKNSNPIRNLNATNRESDIVNNNVIPATPLDTNHKRPEKLRISIAQRKKTHPIQSKSFDTEVQLKVDSPHSSIERPRRLKKLFKVNVRKVDQGTSIERSVPILTQILPQKSRPKSQAQESKIEPPTTVREDKNLTISTDQPTSSSTGLPQKDDSNLVDAIISVPVDQNSLKDPKLELSSKEKVTSPAAATTERISSPAICGKKLTTPTQEQELRAPVLPKKKALAAAPSNQINLNKMSPTDSQSSLQSPNTTLVENHPLPPALLPKKSQPIVLQSKSTVPLPSVSVKLDSIILSNNVSKSQSEAKVSTETDATVFPPVVEKPEIATPEVVPAASLFKPSYQVAQSSLPILSNEPTLAQNALSVVLKVVETPQIPSSHINPEGTGAEAKIMISNVPTSQSQSVEPKTSQPSTPTPPFNAFRRNSAPANFKKLPVVNKPFIRNISGPFLTNVVSNLIAAAEGLNRSNNLMDAKSQYRKSDIFSRQVNNLNNNQNFQPSTSSFMNRNVFQASSSGTAKQDNFQSYKQMLQMMEKEDFIKSSEDIDCPICLSKIPAGEGITLRDCLHSFCKECLIGAIEYSEEPQVRCPFRDNTYSCDSFLQEREVKGLVPPELYDRHLARSVKLAESKMSNTFHCKTNDCTGWCVFEDDVNVFNCPVCKKRNCLTCRAIHERQDCQEYQRELAITAETDEDAKSSRLMLEKMISRGEALDCPACHVVLLKKWGCDWVRCSYCKTEICWVTKGFRWGPNGKGDTSGGCKCGINGVRCHPKCTYCH